MIQLVRRFAQFIALALAAAAATPALAHPHVWVTARAEVVFDAHGDITAIRHVWQFDPDFTAYATLNLDTNHDGKLSMDELQPLADTNIDALGEYDYFTFVYVGTKRIPVAKPTEYWLDFKGGRLTLFYTLPLKEPLKPARDMMIEVGDPEYFVAISFLKGKEVTLDGDAKGCAATFRPPQELTTQTMALLGSIPASQHDLPPDLVQAAASLSNVIRLHCPQAPVSNARPENAAQAIDSLAAPGQSGDTLNAGDRTVAAPAPKSSTPETAAPAVATPKVVILDQNGLPAAPAADVQAQAAPPQSGAATKPGAAGGGIWGWVSGMFQGRAPNP